MTVRPWVVESAVASFAGAGDDQAKGAFGMGHEGCLLVVADAVGPEAHGSGAAHQAVQAFLGRVGAVPESMDEARGAMQRVLDESGLRWQAEPKDGPLDADAVALVAIGLLRSAAVIAHAGSSRCYRVRAGSVAALTHDSRKVDDRRLPIPRMYAHSARIGDRFVLCTAGLWSTLTQEQLHSAIVEPKSADAASRALRTWMSGWRRAYALIVADLVGDAAEQRGG